MSKSRHTPEFRVMVAQAYLNEEGSYAFLAQKYHIGTSTLKKWVPAFEAHGINAFITTTGNKSYTKEFKLACVEAVITGEASPLDIASKNNIHPTVLESWIKLYNCNRELKDYIPKREVLAGTRKKTTIEERKEIVEHCINHNHDYKNTATLFGVSYSQVFNWVKKYDTNGVEGLMDKRGRHKTDDEVDELERLRRENIRLKQQLEERDMVVELLKKVKEFEGR